jgi:hypothetical protein
MNWILISIIIFLALLAGSLAAIIIQAFYYNRHPEIIEPGVTKTPSQTRFNLQSISISVVKTFSHIIIVIIAINTVIAIGIIIWVIVKAINK